MLKFYTFLCCSFIALNAFAQQLPTQTNEQSLITKPTSMALDNGMTTVVNKPSEKKHSEKRLPKPIENTGLNQDSLNLVAQRNNQPNTTSSPTNTITYANMRIGKFYLNNNDCFGEDPDPSFEIDWDNRVNTPRIHITRTNFGTSSCNIWHDLGSDNRHLENPFTVVQGGSTVSKRFFVWAWEDDCSPDYEYNTGSGCFNDDDAFSDLDVNISFPYITALGHREERRYIVSGSATFGLDIEYETYTVRAAEVYSNSSYGGRRQYLGVGNYNVNDIRNGVGNDAISSIYVYPGYKLVAYMHGNFVGYPLVYRGGNVSLEDFNDDISSFKIMVDDGLPAASGRTLMIYYGGTGAEVKREMEKGLMPLVNADDIIMMMGVGADIQNLSAVNNFYGFTTLEEDELYSVNSSTVSVFQNNNFGGGTYRNLFGIQMDYQGTFIDGYDDEDSQEAARNILRVMKRYKLKGYDRIVIAGHSRGSAVGIPSLLFGLKKAILNETNFDHWPDERNTILAAQNINVISLDPVSGMLFGNDYHMDTNWDIEDIYSWLKANYSGKFQFSEVYANGARFSDFAADWGQIVSGQDMVFEPARRFLHDSWSNDVQRYWLGFRHSSMTNLPEKLNELYINGNPKPPYKTAELLNAALNNQTLFRNHYHWFTQFKNNDQEAYWEALRQFGCVDEDIDDPDADLQMEYYYPIRHGNFENRFGDDVNMTTFVGDNDLQLYCAKGFKPPTNAGLYTANRQKTDAAGNTHYCTCTGDLILSLKKGSSGIDVSPNQVSVNVATNPRVEYASAGTGFVTNPDGAVVLRRTWNVSPTTQPTSPVEVSHYFSRFEYDAVNTALQANNLAPITHINQMWFYKSSAPAHASVANTPTATILTHSNTPSLTNWRFDNLPNDIFSATFKVSSFSGGGGGAGGGGANPLPVKLLSFMVAKEDKTHVLNWTTASEQNSNRFEIEYSTDGTNFKTIGAVQAAGNSNDKRNYNFKNNNYQPTNNYYRLNMIDHDGSQEYSNIVHIKEEKDFNADITAYPNPSSTGIFTINSPNVLPSTITVDDALGRSTSLNVENNQIDLSAYPKGVYYIKIKDTTNSGVSTIKLIYQ